MADKNNYVVTGIVGMIFIGIIVFFAWNMYTNRAVISPTVQEKGDSVPKNQKENTGTNPGKLARKELTDAIEQIYNNNPDKAKALINSAPQKIEGFNGYNKTLIESLNYVFSQFSRDEENVSFDSDRFEENLKKFYNNTKDLKTNKNRILPFYSVLKYRYSLLLGDNKKARRDKIEKLNNYTDDFKNKNKIKRYFKNIKIRKKIDGDSEDISIAEFKYVQDICDVLFKYVLDGVVSDQLEIVKDIALKYLELPVIYQFDIIDNFGFGYKVKSNVSQSTLKNRYDKVNESTKIKNLNASFMDNYYKIAVSKTYKTENGKILERKKNNPDDLMYKLSRIIFSTSYYN